MPSPFEIVGPALISFSGGATSGRMLWETLAAHGGELPPDLVVGFANTGKEREETLDFVRDCGERWGIDVVWIERPPGGGFRRVTYETASRSGEPFEALIEERSYLPNPVTRYCTTELKIRPMRNYLRSLGWDDSDWTNVIGLRADEPRRVARLRERHTEGRWSTAVPLFEAGITRADVDGFWSAQPFRLRLRPWEGNCDLCFLKGTTKRQRVIHDRPELAAWWIAQEEKIKTSANSAAVFRADTPSYARLYDVTTRQLRMFRDEPAEACNVDDVGDCMCGDWAA